MKFAEYKSGYELVAMANKSMKWDEVYPSTIQALKDEMPVGGYPHFALQVAEAEFEWYELMRPYYKVWPSVAAAISRASIDVSLDQVAHVGPSTICIRTAEYTVLCRRNEMDIEIRGARRGSRSRVSNGEIVFLHRFDIEKACFFNSSCGSIQEAIDTERDPYDQWIIDAIRLYVGIQLLANDPEFIQPDVLNKDRAKFAETGDQKYVEKAKRRGKFGWNVGEHLENVPHLRRPHFGIRYGYWGGEEITPRLRPVKGAVVHRDKMRRIPTGYITTEGVEIEPA